MSHRAPKYAPLQLSSPRIPLQLFLFGKHAPPSPPPFFNFATSFSTALLSFLRCLCFIGLYCIPATLSFILARGIAFNSFDTSKQVHACTLSCPQLLCHLFAHTDGQVSFYSFLSSPTFPSNLKCIQLSLLFRLFYILTLPPLVLACSLEIHVYKHAYRLQG